MKPCLIDQAFTTNVSNVTSYTITLSRIPPNGSLVVVANQCGTNTSVSSMSGVCNTWIKAVGTDGTQVGQLVETWYGIASPGQDRVITVTLALKNSFTKNTWVGVYDGADAINPLAGTAFIKDSATNLRATPTRPDCVGIFHWWGGNGASDATASIPLVKLSGTLVYELGPCPVAPISVDPHWGGTSLSPSMAMAFFAPVRDKRLSSPFYQQFGRVPPNGLLALTGLR